MNVTVSPLAFGLQRLYGFLAAQVPSWCDPRSAGRADLQGPPPEVGLPRDAPVFAARTW